MFKKNTAVTGFPFGLVSATDGSAITTGTVTGYYTLDGGAQATISGSATHEGNGQWSVNLLAAEMNGDLVGLLFTHASAINASFTIKTTTKLNTDLNDVAATDIVSSGAITTSGGAVSNVTTVATTTTNTDMRGTDNALLAASAPTNFSDMSISATTGLVDVTQAAADKVWGTTTRILTAGTNIVLAKGVGLTGLNDIAATAIVSGGAITTSGGAVVNVTTVATTTTNTDMLTASAVNAEVVDALNVDTYGEPGSVPAATVSIAAKVNWLYALSRNKGTQTATTKTLRNDADSGNIGTSTVSDDGTTFTRGEWS